ncbi:TPA: hypothetical protein ACQUHN_004080 [Bacillus thuringiensis]
MQYDPCCSTNGATYFY